MKISVAKSAGFCFGVKRALSIARETAKKRHNVVMLGDIVHNEDVVKEILAKGIKKIKAIAGDGSHKTLLIRAHGATHATYQRARQLGYTVIDATCPMVKEIHHIARQKEKQGYRIIVIGDKKHDEVLGIIGQLAKKALVIDSAQNIPYQKIKRLRKAAVVMQSTQDIKNAEIIVGKLRNHIPELLVFNTICQPTRLKQKEIMTMPLENEVMVIIGSKQSANSKRLYQLSKSLNKNSFWIQSAKDLRKGWFRNVKSVGIAAGASTPDSTTRSIIKHIKKITG